MGPLHTVLDSCLDDPDGGSGTQASGGQIAYLSTQDAVAAAIIGPTPNQGTFVRQTWTIWLDGDAIPDEVNATLWSSPDGRLWAPTAQYQKKRPGPGGDVFELPIASYFYAVVDRTWSGSPGRPAVGSAIQSAR